MVRCTVYNYNYFIYVAYRLIYFKFQFLCLSVLDGRVQVLPPVTCIITWALGLVC
jgi:hypothetical protein